MAKEKILITGANRGIGLALVQEYVERGDDVLAVCRSSSIALDQTGAKVIDGVDVTDPSNLFQKVEEVLAGKSLNLLINCAGILHEGSSSGVVSPDDAKWIKRQFEVNTLGPILVTSALLSLLHSGSKIAMISSRMGSIADNSSGGYYGYRSSKAALNMYAKSLAIDLRSKKISVGLVHPGYVKTDLTGGLGEITPDLAAKGIAKRIDELNIENSGFFRHSNGANLPW